MKRNIWDKNSVIKLLAMIVSVIFHPLFVPLYVNALMLHHQQPIENTDFFWIILWIGCIIPLALMMLLKRIGKITDMMVQKSEERRLPLIIMCFVYLLLVFCAKQIAPESLMVSFFVGSAVAVFVCLMLHQKLHISLHLTAMGSLVCFIISLIVKGQLPDYSWFLTCVFFSFVVAISRIMLEAHRPQELYVGFLVGFTTMLLVQGNHLL